MIKTIKEKYDLLVYYVIIAILYFFVFIMKELTNISFPFGRMSYQAINTINYLSNLGIWQTFKPIIFDPLTKTVENLVVTPYEQLSILILKFLKFLNLNINESIILFIVSVICFGISIYLITNILKKLGVARKNKNIFMFFFILSPITLFLLMTLSYHVMSFMLILILVNLYLSNINNTKNLMLFSGISFLIMLFGTFYLLNVLIVLGFLVWYKRNNELETNNLKKLFFIVLILFVFGSLLFNLNLYERILSFTGSELFFIYDLGGKIGFSIFTFVLFLIGLISSIRKKKEYYIYYVFIFLGMFAYLLFGATTLIYLNPLICFFASETLIGFMKYRKSEEIIKHITIYCILFGLLFSGLSFMFGLGDLTIDNDTKACLEELKTSEKAIIFSDYKNGYFIKSITQKQVILDDLSIINKKNTIIYDEMEKIFYSINLMETKEFIKKYDIGYIIITDKMIYQEIWTEENQGLVFVLGNKDNFEKLCSFGKNGGVWAYIGD